MNFNSPIPRSGLPRLHESSNQRSARDSDATARVWQKSKTIGDQTMRSALAIEKLQRDLQRLRRRSSSGDLFQFPPFSVYQLPPPFTTVVDPLNMWRTVRVRTGFIFSDDGANGGIDYGFNFISPDGIDNLKPGSTEIGPTVAPGTYFLLPESTVSFVYVSIDPASPSAEIVVDDGSIYGVYPKNPYLILLAAVNVPASSAQTDFFIEQVVACDVTLSTAMKQYGVWAASAPGDQFKGLGYPKGAVVFKVDSGDITQGVAFNWHSLTAPDNGDVNSTSAYVSLEWCNTDDPFDKNEISDPMTPSWRRIGQFRTP